MVQGHMCSGVWLKDILLIIGSYINYCYYCYQILIKLIKDIDLIRFEELNYFYSQIGFVFLTFSLTWVFWGL